jgi:cytochrome c biogenesis protein CcdA
MHPVNVFIAFAGGLFSFVSPCMLPLIPSWVAFAAGVKTRERTQLVFGNCYQCRAIERQPAP